MQCGNQRLYSITSSVQPRHREVDSDLVAGFGGRSRKWQARFSACRFPGRPNTRPSGETTGGWDVHRSGIAPPVR
jgi:hypothetical protein